MRRLLTLSVVSLAFGALVWAPGASAQVLRAPAGDSSTLSLSYGRGFASVNASSGSLIGRMARGTITVVDPAIGTRTSVNVSGCESITHPTARTTVCKGETLAVSAINGTWRVKFQGRGINASAVARGTLRLKGTRGRFSIDGGPSRRWPRVMRTYKLG